ncbi:MAG: glycosyltransferase family 4 protein [Acidimicrobiales bacterium]
MRIAQVAPLYEAVPPAAYGGTERVIGALCDELVTAGHEVTLFASAGSVSDAHIEVMCSGPLRLHMTRSELERIAPHLHLEMLASVFARSGDFDVIHAHTDIWTLPFARDSSTPTLLTMHGRLDLPEVRALLPRYRDVSLASVSDYQRFPVVDLDLPWAATCYNGLDLDAYLAEPTSPGGDYLAFVGRITPEKRPDWAVEVARRAGMPLKVAAKIDPLDLEYWNETIAPIFAANDVEFVGELTEDAKPSFMAGAAALLFPIDWPEPFGLVMVEAMAAGTPVIALDRGSVPEVVQDGVSGTICHTLDDMVAAVDTAAGFDPAACRAVARRFTARNMARRYVEVYRDITRAGRLVPLASSPR